SADLSVCLLSQNDNPRHKHIWIFYMNLYFVFQKDNNSATTKPLILHPEPIIWDLTACQNGFPYISFRRAYFVSASFLNAELRFLKKQLRKYHNKKSPNRGLCL